MEKKNEYIDEFAIYVPDRKCEQFKRYMFMAGIYYIEATHYFGPPNYKGFLLKLRKNELKHKKYIRKTFDV